MGSGHHDALVKTVFGDVEVAAGTLRALLPSDLAEAIDFGTLELVPGEFAERVAGTRSTDLLFQALTCGRPVLLHLNVEHQSSVDPRMPFRLLRYQTDFLTTWTREEDASDVPLPAVVPIVLYHGATPWTGPRSYAELLALDPAHLEQMRRVIPDFEFVLIDLAALSDEHLAQIALPVVGHLALLALKHLRYSTDVIATLKSWLGLLHQVSAARNGRDALDTIFYYLSEVDVELSAVEVKREIEPLLDRQAKEAHVTLKEQWIEEGREEGLEKGLEKGLERGLEKGREDALRTTLVNLLRLKFSDLAPAHLTAIEAADADTLERWIPRVLTATAPAAVLSE